MAVGVIGVSGNKHALLKAGKRVTCTLICMLILRAHWFGLVEASPGSSQPHFAVHLRLSSNSLLHTMTHKHMNWVWRTTSFKPQNCLWLLIEDHVHMCTRNITINVKAQVTTILINSTTIKIITFFIWIFTQLQIKHPLDPFMQPDINFLN